MKLHIINGPNLNLLGTRQPEIYGGQTFEEIKQMALSLMQLHTRILL